MPEYLVTGLLTPWFHGPVIHNWPQEPWLCAGATVQVSVDSAAGAPVINYTPEVYT